MNKDNEIQQGLKKNVPILILSAMQWHNEKHFRIKQSKPSILVLVRGLLIYEDEGVQVRELQSIIE